MTTPKGPKSLILVLLLPQHKHMEITHILVHRHTQARVCTHTDVYMHAHAALVRKWVGLHWFFTQSAHLSFTLSPDSQSIEITPNT